MDDSGGKQQQTQKTTEGVLSENSQINKMENQWEPDFVLIKDD